MSRNTDPKRPTGSDAEAFFMQRVWDSLFGIEGQFISTPTVKVEASSRGIAFHAEPTRGGGERISVERFVLQEVWPNTIRCRTWDGEELGADDVYIAKPERLRHILSRRIDGTTITYTYDETEGSVTRYQFRVATASGSMPENQIVIPRYLTAVELGEAVGNEIWAVRLPTEYFVETDPDDPETSHSVTYLDLNVDGRAWGKQYPPAS